MDDKKKNKSYQPANNKQVRIQMRPGRAMDGVSVDANRFAFVDFATAAHLVKINYAVMAEASTEEEKNDE